MDGNHSTLKLIAGADVKFVSTPEGAGGEEGSEPRIELRDAGLTPLVRLCNIPMKVTMAIDPAVKVGVAIDPSYSSPLKLPSEIPLPDPASEEVQSKLAMWRVAAHLTDKVDVARWMVWIEQRVEMLEGLSPEDRERALRLQLEFTTLEHSLAALMDTPNKIQAAVAQSVDTVGCMNLELAEMGYRLKEAERRTHDWGRLDIAKGYMILWLGSSIGLAIIAVVSLVFAHLLIRV